MSLFGRRTQSRERTPEERERARLEREARRAAREGRPPPTPEELGISRDLLDGNGRHETLDVPFGEPPAEAPRVPDAGSRLAWDDTGAWDPHPPRVRDEPEADAEPPVPAPPAAGEDEERPAWDDTGAWDPEPPRDEPAPGDAAPEPAPTLGQEIASVDRGWFDDGDAGRDAPQGPSEEPGRQGGQETVEWDVLAGQPKTPAEPETGRAGTDQPTVEWDVLTGTREDRAGDAPADAAPPAPSASSSSPAVSRTERFGDEHERPVPTRRVTRSRTLPPPPPGPGERRRRRPGRGTFAAIVGVFLVAVVLYLVNALFQPLADPGTGRVEVTIPQNSSAGEVGEILEREGVVDSAFFFEVRARLSGKDLQAGTHTLQQGMPYGDAIEALSSRPAAPRTVKITIPEGRARREAAPIVQKAGLRGSYLEASERARGFNPRRYGAPRRPRSLEGFLFPATYELRPDATARQLVAQQLETFEREIKRVDMRRARRRNLSTYDVLIIASMIEREATLARERRIISAVIHNRLREGMPLGIDATIRYATRNWSRPLKQSELNIDSPYNTRRRTGLPPTPIGSPGLASIKAAANPAKVDYLYYVVKPGGDGAHAFSSTEAEFQRDVDAYNRERERRGGKDPSSSRGG
jgi:uncharacterized YceG family protein